VPVLLHLDVRRAEALAKVVEPGLDLPRAVDHLTTDDDHALEIRQLFGQILPVVVAHDVILRPYLRVARHTADYHEDRNLLWTCLRTVTKSCTASPSRAPAIFALSFD
jgi:hypothetical protein